MAETPGRREPEALSDDTLRLLFVCFHPQLSEEAQTALALRTLGGLSAAEIASAFLVSEAAIAKRLVRARQRIRELAVPFAVPAPSELPARLDAVLGTLYLMFNEGHKASSGDTLVRDDLCREAIRLVQMLAEHPQTQTPRTWALLALMTLTAARLPARTDEHGQLRRLHEQDRSTWDTALIGRGMEALARSAAGETLSAYHLEAGIAACHAVAPDAAATDWARILALYNQLMQVKPTPVVALNRAVALARVAGPRAGLDALDAMATQGRLGSYHLYHAIRAALAAELGDVGQALAHFRQAGDLAEHPVERAFLAQRVADVQLTKPRA
jgi:RNA polymerase sigma-70 factor (ECF subfamily)